MYHDFLLYVVYIERIKTEKHMEKMNGSEGDISWFSIFR
jgi:hypothetical protein